MRLRNVAAAVFLVAATSILILAPGSRAAGSEPTVTFKNGRIEPGSVVVPAGRSFRLKVVNAGTSAVEFESFDLNRERVVAPGQTVTVYMPGLRPGSYDFVDDFHRNAGKGTILAH